MIRFHLLGAGGALPTPTHNPAAYWVVVDGTALLVDPGPGALVRLARAGLIPAGVDDIGQVLLSHLHPDHTLDLIALLFATHSPLPGSEEPLRIAGPGGLTAVLDGWKSIYGRWLEPRRRPVEIEEWTPGTRLDLPAGGTVEAFAVDHPQDRLADCCFGFKFTDRDGRTAVYSGDSGPCPGLTTAATAADLLVIECSTPDELETPGHLCPREVGAICRAAKPGRVVLTHQYPPAAATDLVAAVGNHYGSQVVQGHDGLVLTLPHRNGDDPC